MKYFNNSFMCILWDKLKSDEFLKVNHSEEYVQFYMMCLRM